MKIECEHCGAGYSVADEKIAGRALKLRCKKCGEVIRVDGREIALPDQAPATAAEETDPAQTAAPDAAADNDNETDNDTDTQAVPDYGPDPFGEGPEPFAGAAASQPETGGDADAIWHIAVGDSTQGPYTLPELATYYAQGSVVLDTLIFRDGWSDWQPAGEVAELTEMAREAAFESPAGPGGGLNQPVSMGEDPFAERALAPSPRLSGEQMAAPGGHEGTVQFSLEEMKAISAVSAVPSTVPGALSSPLGGSQDKPGFASGEGSGLIDMRALAQMAATSTTESSHGADDDSGIAPLDSLLPLSLPSTPPQEDSGYRTKLFAGLAAFGMLLAAGVAALAVLYRPEPPQAPVSVATVQPPAPEPTAAAQPAEEEAIEEEAAEEPAEEVEAEQEAPEAAAAAAPKAEPRKKAAKNSGPSKPKTAAKRKDKEAPREEKAAPRKEKKELDINDVLVDKRKPERKAKGGDALDDLLLGALDGKKKPAPRAEPKAASNLPKTPSRDAIKASWGKAGAKAKRCPGSGVATADITISGSNGRVSKVSVSGVQGASKSCVEKAVRSTPFPKFQNASFQVKLPFKLKG